MFAWIGAWGRSGEASPGILRADSVHVGVIFGEAGSSGGLSAGERRTGVGHGGLSCARGGERRGAKVGQRMIDRGEYRTHRRDVDRRGGRARQRESVNGDESSIAKKTVAMEIRTTTTGRDASRRENIERAERCACRPREHRGGLGDLSLTCGSRRERRDRAACCDLYVSAFGRLVHNVIRVTPATFRQSSRECDWLVMRKVAVSRGFRPFGRTPEN